jgi:uncharacterized protein (TIGR02452 family)
VNVLEPTTVFSVSRKQAAALGHDTLRILREGSYRTDAGAVVAIDKDLRHAVEGTRSYPPDQGAPRSCLGGHATRFEVCNETTLAAARRLVGEGHRPVALNFASAKNPGGGFLSGARAQEESLCRSSGLYACLLGNPMYEFHRHQGDALYSSYVLYSPDVPVFRDDDGTLLDRPYRCSFLTSPAVNAGALRTCEGQRGHAIRNAMTERVSKVLGVAAQHGHDVLVLGAWGCGAFHNDPEVIAELFHNALTRRFQGAFARVIFAILDWSDDDHFIGPFQRRFGAEMG